MVLNAQRVRDYLDNRDFESLFIEELGWNSYSIRPLVVTVGDETYTLTPIAELAGVGVFECPFISDRSTRLKIERSVAKTIFEHLIIFNDASQQVWQWVKRSGRKPMGTKEYRYYPNRSNDALIQRLNPILFTFNDLDELGQAQVTDVTERLRQSFDADEVTKRFYDRFKKERDAFSEFIDGIPERDIQLWYVSVVINRLMFIYFIQKKGLLGGNINYLRDKLNESVANGQDFYVDFLRPLFFEGFAKQPEDRDVTMNRRLGDVPYLNGGLFQVHEIEERFPDISISPDAFAQIFDFFDRYRWNLDERPVRAEKNEINPDVLGYIFEKYVNQKDMGAYYTKEDITDYICKNTIIPNILDRLPWNEKEMDTMWALLREQPERYIYKDVLKGVDLPLPVDMMVSTDSEAWNSLADPTYGLPTETWRDVMHRRGHYIRLKTAVTSINTVDELVTHNVDLQQFVLDVIVGMSDPRQLLGLYNTLKSTTVLDPTCGSGAFLFAALNVLEPLYEACLDRIQGFIEDSEYSTDLDQSVIEQLKTILREYPNRRYFVIKSIIVNNLYGVDIMDEATEICKLRLFLKLVAQAEVSQSIEPLPDIDFNIQAGNSLVGFATLDDVTRTLKSTLDIDNTLEIIEKRSGMIDDLKRSYRALQTRYQSAERARAQSIKTTLKSELKILDHELNRALASVYGANVDNDEEIRMWYANHKPFHWYTEFHDIMLNGGFDVIVGNPPYVEYSKVKNRYTVRNYSTETCGNLYAFVVERNRLIANNNGRTGMIIPHSAFCTDRMAPLMNLFTGAGSLWVSTYCIRPSKLFVGADQRLAIYLHKNINGSAKTLEFSTRYHHWHESYRPHLFNTIKYTSVDQIKYTNSLPKLGTELEEEIWDKVMLKRKLPVDMAGTVPVFYHNAPRYWIRAMTHAPYFRNDRDGERLSDQVKILELPNERDAKVVAAVINSSLFFWWFTLLSDCRHLNKREIDNFPFGLEDMEGPIKNALGILCDQLMDDLIKHSVRREIKYKTTGKVVYDEFYPRHSKGIIDLIDKELAKHYSFTQEMTDFVINYEVKFRVGANEDQ